MYFRSSQRLGSHSTHVFPRGKDGGVVLGGCRLNGDSNEQFDPVIGQGIKERCCALVPELGRAENLRIIKQGVGFRRKHFLF
jgi:D-amino-acid oxidase